MAKIRVFQHEDLAPRGFLVARAIKPETLDPIFDFLDEKETRRIESEREIIELARAFGLEEEKTVETAREFLSECALYETTTEDPGFFLDSTRSVELYLGDLLPEKQREVLEAFGLARAEDGNLDLVPLATLEVERRKEGS